MKRAWTRGEKLLWATPILFGVVFAAVTSGPEVARRALGWPKILMTAPDTQIRSMALSHNGEILAAGGVINTPKGWKRGSGTVHLWNARTGEKLAAIPPVYIRDRRGFTNGFDIYALALSSDAKQVGFSRVSQNWALYDVATQQQLWSFPSSIADAEFSRDGRFIALRSGGGIISIVGADDGRVRTQWKTGGLADSNDLAWSPDGAWIATIGPYKADDPIELYRADTGKLVRRIQSPQVMSRETVASVDFSPDSKRLLVAASPGSYSSTEDFNNFAPVRCYDSSTGRLLWEVKTLVVGGANGFHASFCDAIFSPDGRVVAAYQYLEGRIFLLDSATGAIKSINQLGGAARSTFYVPPGLAFSPDGKRLFVRGKDAVLFWDLE
jgi:WD40 repeat protein